MVGIGIPILGIFLLNIMITLPVSDLQADSINPGVYSIDEKPNGFTYDNLTAKWWQWALSIPQDVNPIGDTTGKYCGQNQSGPVWFLVGTFGGAAERTCEIPAGKAILIPLLTAECNYLENPELKTESELRTCARQGQDAGSRTLAAAVDGTQLKNLENYRVESQLFDLAFPENNVFSVTPGKTKAVSDGFWIILEPLSSGNHDLDFSGSIVDPSGVNNYNSQAKYHLIVKEPTNSTTTE
jgi:hypothetical protein